MSKNAKRGEVGSRERKGREKDEMKGKGCAARFKVGPRAPSSRASLHLRAKPTLRATNYLLVSFSILLNPRNVHLDPERTGMQTEMNCATTVSESGNRENPNGQKIESFILCLMFLVPRNAKQRRGNCHNPIFTHGIFSGVDTQNEAARTKPA